MKVVEFRINDKLVVVEQIKDVTPKQFLDLQKEAKQTWNFKDQQIVNLLNNLSNLQAQIGVLESKIADLYKQIAFDRGEIDESGKDFTVSFDEPQQEQVVEPQVTEEEDEYFEEKEGTEENE